MPVSVAHYQKIISILSEATLILTSSGKVVTLNGPAAQLLGMSAEEAEGIFLFPVTCSEEDVLASYLRQCARSKSPVIGSLIFLGQDGEKQHFTVKGAVLEPREGEREALLMLRLFPKWETSARFQALRVQIDRLHREVSKRRRAEYEFKTQKQWLEVTLTSIGDAVITTDANRSVTFLNPVAETKTGWAKEDAIGQPLNDIFVILNEYTRHPVESPVEKALADGQVVALANHTILVAKDGSEISIEDTAAPISLDDGIEGAILVFHDVSERRQLERQLMERAETLELANRRKNEFLTMLAHELRGPLTPINNAIEIMGLQEDVPLSFKEPQKIIGRQVQHLKRLIDDMLDMSRITSGKMQIRRERVDFSALIRLACTDFEAQFASAEIHFNTSVPTAPVWLDADPHRLTQIMHNLLLNALKFTPSGGAVSVTLSVDNQLASLQIVDTGKGIDPSVMPDLFEPFTQGSQSLARRKGGLGLGLSLVKGIVDLHHGQVIADSGGVDGGTQISVRLPLMGNDVEPAIIAKPSSAMSSQRILLIEDGEDAATTMCQLLNLLGHEVHVANTGPKGLKMATAFAPSLVICDIGLPGLNGFEVAERLRANPNTAAIPLVAITGYGGADFVERAQKAGFDQHITKPASLSDIEQAIRLIEPDEYEHFSQN